MATDAPADAGRHETEAERIDRNLDELLQELRVATIGVQVLFAFLLSMPFTTRFVGLDSWQRALYFIDLLFAAVAVALLIGPAAHHRIVFRQHKKERLLYRANRMAIGGLIALAFSMSGSVLLVASVVTDGLVVALVGGATAVIIFGVWLVPPLADRRRGDY